MHTWIQFSKCNIKIKVSQALQNTDLNFMTVFVCMVLSYPLMECIFGKARSLKYMLKSQKAYSTKVWTQLDWSLQKEVQLKGLALQ